MPQVHKVGGLIGAELRGLDLTREYPDETYDAILRAWAEHGVIFLRGQQLNAEQRDAFAARLGEIRVRQELRKEPEQTKAVGEGWHTDMTCFDEPPKATILFCEEVPPWGGDTQWAAMGPTFEALSAGLQADPARAARGPRERAQARLQLRANRPARAVGGGVRRGRGPGAPGRPPHPRDGAAGALRQPRVHHAVRGLDAAGVAAAAAVPVRLRHSARSSSPGSTGRPAPSRCGTTGRPGISRSTTTRASAASCTASCWRAQSRSPQRSGVGHGASARTIR